MSVSDLFDLSTTEFRFVTKRDALPTNYVHFTLAPLKQSKPAQIVQSTNEQSTDASSKTKSTDQSNDQTSSQHSQDQTTEQTSEQLSKEKMFALLSPFGRLIGLSIKQSNKGGYAQFEFAHCAGAAVTSLNQTINFGGKMLLTFAATKEPSTQQSTSQISDSSSKQSNSRPKAQLSDHLPALSSIRLYKNILSNFSNTQPSNQSVTQSSNPFVQFVEGLNKPMLHFGAALEEEDDKFGLPAPKPIEESVKQAISQLVDVINKGYHENEQSINQSIEQPSATSNEQPKKLSNIFSPSSASLTDSTSSSNSDQAIIQSSSQSSNHPTIPLFDRITYQSLMPGAGIKPVLIDDQLFERCNGLMTLQSSLLVDIYHSTNQSNQFIMSILMPVNSLLIIPSHVASNYSVGVAYRTRDLINEQSVKRSKVSILKLLKVRTPDSFDQSLGQPITRSNKQSQPRSKQRLGLTSNNRKIVSAALPTELSQLQSSDPSALERMHVQDVYDTIACHFSSTRHSPWPRVESYVRGLTGGVYADIACGNGKYMGLNPAVRMVGCDLSKPLVDICVKKGYDAVVGDCMALPWDNERFDGAISVALLHHISSAERRKQALSEMLRVVKPGARVLVTAWAMEQDETSRRTFEAQDVLVPWKLPSKFKPSEIEANNQANQTNQSNNQTTNQDDGIECQRYCHVYTEGEIEGLLDEIGGNRVVERYYDRGNWVVIFEKAHQ